MNKRRISLAVIRATVVAQFCVASATADEGWSKWCEAVAALAAAPDLATVAPGQMPERLAAIATLAADPGHDCGEDFKVAATGPVGGGYALALAPSGAACEAFRFGMVDLALLPRSAADVAGLRVILTARFGEPATSEAGEGRRTDHWQVDELRAVELQYEVRSPGLDAGVTIANVPPDVAAERKPRKRQL